MCVESISKWDFKDWKFKTKSKGSLGRRGDISSSEPSSGEKPVR